MRNIVFGSFVGLCGISIVVTGVFTAPEFGLAQLGGFLFGAYLFVSGVRAVLTGVEARAAAKQAPTTTADD